MEKNHLFLVIVEKQVGNGNKWEGNQFAIDFISENEVKKKILPIA